MAAGDVTIKYGDSTDMTVTNLHGIATSTTFIAGWESATIDNTSTKFLDFLMSGTIQIHDDAAPGAGSQVRVYIVAMTSDTTWPDLMDGTESTDAFAGPEQMLAVAKLGCVISPLVTSGQNIIYSFGPFSVANLYGGACPPKFVVFITHNTGANLHTSGNLVTYQGVSNNVAAS